MNNLKRIGILAFVFLLFFSSLRTTVIMGFYTLSPGTFVELFCENKDKPEIHCNGNCELTRLAQQNAGHSEDAVLLDFFQQETVFVTEFFDNFQEENTLIISENHLTPFVDSHYAFELLESKDRPPVLV